MKRCGQNKAADPLDLSQGQASVAEFRPLDTAPPFSCRKNRMAGRARLSDHALVSAIRDTAFKGEP